MDQIIVKINQEREEGRKQYCSANRQGVMDFTIYNNNGQIDKTIVISCR